MEAEMLAAQKQRNALRDLIWGEEKHAPDCPFHACECEVRDAHLCNWENDGPNATEEIICLQRLFRAIESDMRWLQETVDRVGTFHVVLRTHLSATCEALDRLRDIRKKEDASQTIETMRSERMRDLCELDRSGLP